MPLCSRPFSSSITLFGTRAGRSPSMIKPITPGTKRAACTECAQPPSGLDSPFTKTGVWLLRRRFATESSRSLRRQVGCPWAAGRRTGSTKGDLVQPVPGFNARFHRSAAGRYLKVSPFDFHRHGPTAQIRFLTPGPDLVGHRNHARLDPAGSVRSSGKVVSDPEDFRSRSGWTGRSS